jgi:hypothetical protein
MFLRNILQRDFLWFCFATLPQIKIRKIPQNQKLFSPTTTERITDGQHNLTGNRAEDRCSVTKKKKKMFSKYEECYFALEIITLPNLRGKNDWVCCQKCNVWYHEMCVGAKGNMQFICGRRH